MVFKEIYEKLTSDLESKKQEMENIVRIANSANEDREAATDELAQLIKQAENEKKEFDNQI